MTVVYDSPHRIVEVDGRRKVQPNAFFGNDRDADVYVQGWGGHVVDVGIVVLNTAQYGKVRYILPMAVSNLSGSSTSSRCDCFAGRGFCGRWAAEEWKGFGFPHPSVPYSSYPHTLMRSDEA